MKINNRDVQHDILPLFAERWSPRAFTGEPISKKQLMQLLEAARWAPSSYNGQPWRFVYALKDTEYWDALFDFLVEFNQSWCKNASALLVVISKKISDHNGKPAPTHSFDSGAAWQNIALQTTYMGLAAHGMGGIDKDKIRKTLKLSDDYTIECMIAVGKPGEKSVLPEELQEKETQSDRKAVEEFSFEGIFKE
jgi:nitroreductase